MIEIPKATKYKSPKPKVLDIDFDRVIHDIDHPIEGNRMGPPMANAQEFMEQLCDDGFRLNIYTLRAKTDLGVAVVRDWLDFWRVPYHAISAQKSDSDMYIDEKAYRFIEWSAGTIEDIYNLLGISQ